MGKDWAALGAQRHFSAKNTVDRSRCQRILEEWFQATLSAIGEVSRAIQLFPDVTKRLAISGNEIGIGPATLAQAAVSLAS
jgi:hypothetical protein